MSEKRRLLGAVFKAFSPVAESEKSTESALCGDARTESMLCAESAADRNEGTLLYCNSLQEGLQFRASPLTRNDIHRNQNLDFLQLCECR